MNKITITLVFENYIASFKLKIYNNAHLFPANCVMFITPFEFKISNELLILPLRNFLLVVVVVVRFSSNIET